MSGTVHVNGAPVQTGELRLTPADRAAPSAAAIIRNGHYEVSAFPGRKRIEIQAYLAVGEVQVDKGMPEAGMVPVSRPMLPAKYNIDSQEFVDLQGDVVRDFDIRVE